MFNTHYLSEPDLWLGRVIFVDMSEKDVLVRVQKFVKHEPEKILKFKQIEVHNAKSYLRGRRTNMNFITNYTIFPYIVRTSPFRNNNVEKFYMCYYLHFRKDINTFHLTKNESAEEYYVKSIFEIVHKKRLCEMWRKGNCFHNNNYDNNIIKNINNNNNNNNHDDDCPAMR